MGKLPLVWSNPKNINTKHGPRVLRTAKIEKDSPFWKLWGKHKVAIKGVSISISKDRNGNWEACHWGMPEDAAPPADITPPKPVDTTGDQIHKAGVIIPASKALPTTAPLAAPGGGLEYMPFQKDGILFHRGRNRTLIADEMGLGKTVQALGIINDSRSNMHLKSYDRVLVLCPASLKLNWAAEAKKWLRGTLRTRIIEGLKGKIDHLTDAIGGDTLALTICNYEVLHAYSDKFAGMFDLVVLDEAQYIKSMESKRSKAARDLWMKAPEQHVLFLTGTPIMNRPEEIFPIYDACRSGVRKNWMQFTDYYCNAYTDRFGRHTHGASNLGDLHTALKEFTVRRLKKDVLPQLPDKRRHFIELNPTSNALASYLNQTSRAGDDLQKDINRLSKSGLKISDYEQRDMKLKEMSKLRQQQGIAKVPICVEHIKLVLQNIGPDGKVILFAHHTEVVEQLAQQLSIFRPACITGATSTQQKDDAVRRFQNAKACRVFIGNIQAAGTGLTLTAASTVIFVESDWSPSQNLQCEDRAHRIGQGEPVIIQYLNVTGSLDMKIARSCMRKMEISNSAVDGVDGCLS